MGAPDSYREKMKTVSVIWRWFCGLGRLNRFYVICGVFTIVGTLVTIVAWLGAGGTTYRIKDISGGNNQFGSGNTQVINPEVTNVQRLQAQVETEKKTIRTFVVVARMILSVDWAKQPKSTVNAFPRAMWKSMLFISCSTNSALKLIELAPQKCSTDIQVDRKLVVEYTVESSPGQFPLGAKPDDLMDYDTLDFVVPIVNYEGFAKGGRLSLRSWR